VLGIDGLSREMLQKLAADAPALSALASESFRAPIAVAEPVVPPVSWTTIATGVSPAEHGIRMPEARRWSGLSSWMQMTPLDLAMHSVLADAGFGQRQPVSGYMRRAKSFWEILADGGVPTGVVNWWGSWPARPQRGWNISERYYYKRASGAPPQNETFPPELFSRYEAPQGATPSGPALDSFYLDIFRRQMRDDPVRVGALYLPGLDILNHDFFQRHAMDPFEYTSRYREHLRRLDDGIRDILGEHAEARVLVILHEGRSLAGNHSSVLIRTPGAPAHDADAVFSDADLAPLLLHTCGFPVSRAMSPALAQALDPSAVVRFVSSFPKHETMDAGHADEFNDLLVEQMKSLGYLQ
jgi:hypothetical protein